MKFKVEVKGANKVKNLSNSVGKVNKQLKTTQKHFNKISHGKIEKNIIGGVKNIEKSFNKLTGSDALKAPMKGFTKGFGKAKGQGKSMLTQLTSGFKGATKAIKFASGGVKAFIGDLATAFAPLALIAAAFYVIKTAFKANVGGIASSFYKLFGQVKSMLGQFQAGFIKSLRKLGPLIKVIIQPIVTNIKMIFAVIKGVVKGIGAILNPILDALGEMGKALGMVSNQGQQMKAFNNIMKGVTWTLTALGKVIGWIVKVTLKPLVVMFKLIGMLGKAVWGQMSKGVEKWKKILQPVFNMIKKIFDWFSKMSGKSKEVKANVEHKLGIDKVKKLISGGEGNNTTNNHTDNRRISVFTNKGIDKKSFGEDSMIRAIGA